MNFALLRGATWTLALSPCWLGCDPPAPMPADLSQAPDASGPARKLDPALPWYGDIRSRLDALIDQRGTGAAGYGPARPPVAAFDWDNTVIRNDIGDATLFWMIKNGKVRQPPQKNWRTTSPWLTADAAAALGTACGALAEPGAPLPTATGAPCASEIVTIYSQGRTTGGKTAFSGWNYRRMEPASAWAAQLQVGYTAAESRAFAESALQENLAAPEGAKQKIGDIEGLTAWIRIYEQQKDLIGTPKARGRDVWGERHPGSGGPRVPRLSGRPGPRPVRWTGPLRRRRTSSHRRGSRTRGGAVRGSSREDSSGCPSRGRSRTTPRGARGAGCTRDSLDQAGP